MKSIFVLKLESNFFKNLIGIYRKLVLLTIVERKIKLIFALKPVFKNLIGIYRGHLGGGWRQRGYLPPPPPK